jgi:ATP-dependent Lhr-like helicase
MLRGHSSGVIPVETGIQPLSAEAQAVREALSKRGALFFHEMVSITGLLPTLVERGLAELAGAGIATADAFAGLRALLARQDKRRDLVEAAGRWSLLEANGNDFEAIARTLLKRYGVVFRSMLVRETNLPPWRELVRIYRRLEARGEIRGGRFVAGMSGEQFALVEAVERLREIRRTPAHGRCVAVSAADPLNLAGVITAGDRIRAAAANRIVYRDGIPLAVLEGEYVRSLIEVEPAIASDAAKALTGRPLISVVSGFVGR